VSDRVVNFADMAFRLRWRRYMFDKDRCEHLTVTLDDNGGIITCDTCNKQLDPYVALSLICERWERHARDHQSARERIAADAKAVVHLRAAKKVEQAWRRGMAPLCPHCDEPILPEDNMGCTSVDRERVREQRRFKGTSNSSGDEKHG